MTSAGCTGTTLRGLRLDKPALTTCSSMKGGGAEAKGARAPGVTEGSCGSQVSGRVQTGESQQGTQRQARRWTVVASASADRLGAWPERGRTPEDSTVLGKNCSEFLRGWPSEFLSGKRVLCLFPMEARGKAVEGEWERGRESRHVNTPQWPAEPAAWHLPVHLSGQPLPGGAGRPGPAPHPGGGGRGAAAGRGTCRPSVKSL